jgi:hypothetical protein
MAHIPASIGPLNPTAHEHISQEFPEMSKKLMGTVILAGLALGLAAPVMAKSAPKTKSECQKITTMKWDDASSKCVKK